MARELELSSKAQRSLDGGYNSSEYAFSWGIFTNYHEVNIIGTFVAKSRRPAPCTYFTVRENSCEYGWKLIYEEKVNALSGEIDDRYLSLSLESFNGYNVDNKMFINLAVEMKDINDCIFLRELSTSQNEFINMCKKGEIIRTSVPDAILIERCHREGHSSIPLKYKTKFVIKITIISKDLKKSTLRNDNQLSTDFEKLYIGQYLTDVTFVFNNNIEIQAHKVILMARSPVFHAMFQSDMLESKDNRVQIEDIDLESFEKLIHYIYTGKVEITSEDNVANIIVGADKYGLTEFKDNCEKAVINMMNVENAADNFIVAHLLNLGLLKSKTIEFILSEREEIVKTDGYKNLLKNHTHLIGELFEKS